jgi:hypothetical protein
MNQQEIINEVNVLIEGSGWIIDDYDGMDGFIYVTIRKPSN